MPDPILVARALSAVAREHGYRKLSAEVAFELGDPSVMAIATITVHLLGEDAPIKVFEKTVDLEPGQQMTWGIAELAEHPEWDIKIIGIKQVPEYGSVEISSNGKSLTYTAPDEVHGKKTDIFEYEVDREG